MKKTITIVAALAATIGLSQTGCTAEHPVQHRVASTATATSTPTPTPEKEAGPDGTAAHPYPFGTLTVTDVGSQWDVTLTNVNMDAVAMVAAQDPYSQLNPADKYVYGTITATVNKNLTAANTGKSVTPGFSLTPVYVGGDGKIYDESTEPTADASVTGQWLSAPAIVNNVGVSSTGNFAIPVPASAIAGGHIGIQNSTSSKIVYFQ